MLVYFSSETAQEWGPGRGDPGDCGGAFWLPGNALLELRMVPPVSRGRAADAQVGLTFSGTDGRNWEKARSCLSYCILQH